MAPDKYGQIGRAYERLVREADYRPSAPGDGHGHITGPVNLGREQARYAKRWIEEENSRIYDIGCPDYSWRPALIMCVEAARACCASDSDLAMRLLELAIDEVRLMSG